MTTAKERERTVLLSSTVDPAYVAALGPRLANHGIALLDAPVSGGPAKAAAGTMTMMVSGDADALARVRALLDRIAGRVFVLGPRPGDASTFKIVNNMLAAANLAAAAEALALADAAGLDLERVCEVVHASSGASWIFADRAGRALGGDYLSAGFGAPPRQGRRHRVGTRDAPRPRCAVRATSRRRRSPPPSQQDAATTTMRCSCASPSTPRRDGASASRGHRESGRAARYFGRGFMSTSTYCQTCPLMGCAR